MALQTGCKIFIVDNLTYLCCAMEKGDAAGRLMIQLNRFIIDICNSFFIINKKTSNSYKLLFIRTSCPILR